MYGFLKEFYRWGFSPLRIQKWGAKQAGYEKLELYNTREIKDDLERLLKDELIEYMRSKKGNRLFRYKPNDSVN